MKLRLSNGYSYAVEFSADNQQSFRLALRRAGFEYFAHEGKNRSAQLHVATDDGNWLSANYPRSNNPYYVSHGDLERAEWNKCAFSNNRGTWFEYELQQLASTVSRP